jgi:tRNA (guanine26-N2/guanine27-N2)-dimethyltransferase
MKIMLIQEGKTKLVIPKDYLKKSHFFNPKMELARDLTVLILNTLKTKDWVVCDALTGIGARGIRIANECKVKCVWLNDINGEVLKFIEKNVELNKVKNVKILNKDANLLLSENKRNFDYIDIDPFGSCIFYMDSVARSIKNNGLIGLTATDTAPLSGTNPVTCLRRYGVKSYRTDFYRELGLRILLGSVALILSRWSFSLKPLLTYAYEHYYRIWGLVSKGKKRTNECVKKNLGYINYCSSCLLREITKVPKETCDYCKKKLITIGLIWIGDIENERFILKAEKTLNKTEWLKTRKEIKNLLSFLRNESKVPLYYDIHKLCKKHKISSIPKFELVEKKLKSQGFKAYRTHFCRTGLKVDASLKELLNVINLSY